MATITLTIALPDLEAQALAMIVASLGQSSSNTPTNIG
jgi:hypothetical protein